MLERVFNKLNKQLDQETIDKFCASHNYPLARFFLKRFLEYLKVNNLFEVPMMKGRRGKKLLKWLYPDEVYEIANNLKMKDKLIVRIMFEAGLRVSEVINIKRQDIDFTNNRVKGMGKGGKEYIQNLKEETIIMLKEWCFNNEIPKFDPDEKIFLYRCRSRVFQIIQKAGKDVLGKEGVSPHWFRHSCGTEMKRKGMDLIDIKEYLRHERLETVGIYVHATKEEVSEKWKKAMEEKENAI